MSSIILIMVCLLSEVASAQTGKNPKILQSLARSEHRLNFAVTASRLRTDVNADRAYRDLDTMLSKEYGDMFWMYGMTGLYHSTKEMLPDTIKQKIRSAWKHLTPYRGDTENHFLMYYSSLFLMSEVWPGLEGSEWFTGQSSKEINRESKEYLLHWIDQVSKYGLNEFDSPRYQYYFFTPMILLAQYSQDSSVKKKSELLLELMIADFAVKYVKGNYVGAHSRTTEAYALTGTRGEVGAYGEYFFEDSVINLQPDLGFVALTSYECPAIIKHIAKDKTFPFEVFESKRQRPALRYTKSDPPVPKYTYIDSAYSLGSLPGGIVQPIQQQSWKLVFHDRLSPNTITGLHPYRSSSELATYFPEEPRFQSERIESTKAGYSSENKWVGGSPYEKIEQLRNMIRVEYSIPPTEESQHADLFVPGSDTLEPIEGRALTSDTVQARDWILGEHDGQTFGFYFLHSPFKVIREEKGTRFRSIEPLCGYVVWVGKGASVKMLDRMEELRTRRTREAYRTLYRSPYINAKRGSGVITLTYGKHKRVLNFLTGRVREE